MGLMGVEEQICMESLFEKLALEHKPVLNHQILAL